MCLIYLKYVWSKTMKVINFPLNEGKLPCTYQFFKESCFQTNLILFVSVGKRLTCSSLLLSSETNVCIFVWNFPDFYNNLSVVRPHNFHSYIVLIILGFCFSPTAVLMWTRYWWTRQEIFLLSLSLTHFGVTQQADFLWALILWHT